jgi:hypothetical protein
MRSESTQALLCTYVHSSFTSRNLLSRFSSHQSRVIIITVGGVGRAEGRLNLAHAMGDGFLCCKFRYGESPSPIPAFSHESIRVCMYVHMYMYVCMYVPDDVCT